MNDDCVLAYTGSGDVTLWLGLAVVLIAAGVVLLVPARRRRASVPVALVALVVAGALWTGLQPVAPVFADQQPCPTESGPATVRPSSTASASSSPTPSTSPSASTSPSPSTSPTASASPSPSPTVPVLGSLSGVVWFDRDGDGVRDAGEPVIAGVVVHSSDGSSVTTGADGSYLVSGLGAGTYTVSIDTTTTPVERFSVQADNFDYFTTPGEIQILSAGGTVLEKAAAEWSGCQYRFVGVLPGTGHVAKVVDAGGVDRLAELIAAQRASATFTAEVGGFTATHVPGAVDLAAAENRLNVDFGLTLPPAELSTMW